MTVQKRIFDILLCLLLMALLALPFAILCVVLILIQGRPIFYVSERMTSSERGFSLWKLRTMRVATHDQGVSGGDKADRITPVGRWLRKYRLDEIPQLWNVLIGDMSFVGPRPPLRQYVESFPEIYAAVLQCRPGITGLATLSFHAHEDYLLQQCKTAAETNEVYARRCIPRKARLDLIYRDRQNLCLDTEILIRTVTKVIRRRSKRRLGTATG